MKSFINKIKKEYNKIFLVKIAIALIGVAFIGFGIAFNSAAMLGNDAVAILYDGVRNACRLPQSGLGIITNIVNYSLIIIVVILNRRYINIGTFIYTIPMGTFVGIGAKIYDYINFPFILEWRILSAICGCSMIFIGLGIFIAIDIGLDPFTCIAMILRDKIKSQFRTAKIICDITSVTIGFSIGGKAGLVTAIAAFAGGPSIQFVSELFKKVVLVHLKINKDKI